MPTGKECCASFTTIFEEMDYVKEGRNADRFRYNFRTWRRSCAEDYLDTHQHAC